MLIRNNTTSPHFVPIPGSPNPATDVTLWPGVNRVDPKFWADLLKVDKVFQFYVEEGLFEEVDADSPAKMSEAAACKLVGNTAVDELLAEWQKGEKRTRVKNALKAQRAKLVLPEPERKGLDDNTVIK